MIIQRQSEVFGINLGSKCQWWHGNLYTHGASDIAMCPAVWCVWFESFQSPANSMAHSSHLCGSLKICCEKTLKGYVPSSLWADLLFSYCANSGEQQDTHGNNGLCKEKTKAIIKTRFCVPER